jgi:hypothetical protein
MGEPAAVPRPSIAASAASARAGLRMLALWGWEIPPAKDKGIVETLAAAKVEP